MDSLKTQIPTIVISDNNMAPLLGGGHYTKNRGIWTLKYEIRSPKFYEIFINK